MYGYGYTGVVGGGPPEPKSAFFITVRGQYTTASSLRSTVLYTLLINVSCFLSFLG